MTKSPNKIETSRIQWASVIQRELEAAGVAHTVSEHLIEQAAIAKAELDQLQGLVDRQGIIYTTASRNGSTMRRTNPAYTELKDLRKAWLKLLMQMGLTPVSAKRLGIVAYSDEFD